MKEIVKSSLDEDKNWAYSPTKGLLETRIFLAKKVSFENNVKLVADDIIFFNGLGDAICKIYTNLKKDVRIIGSSPAYPTHSSMKGSHAGYPQITYTLKATNNWRIDLEDLRNQVKYNRLIIRILIINPDNPTGMVFKKEELIEIVKIAKEFELFIVSDEIYGNLVYNGAKMVSISGLLNGTPALILKGISKELPWPGSRCGWIEIYNKNKDVDFSKYVDSIINAKMLEVCSTTLPQVVIPKILSSEEFPRYLAKRQEELEIKSNLAFNILKGCSEIIVSKTQGAFYMSVVFRNGVLNNLQSLEILDPKLKRLVERKVKGCNFDKCFVYYLLANCGICVVCLSSFNTDVQGFRITFLEKDLDKFEWIFNTIKAKIKEYVNSSQ